MRISDWSSDVCSSDLNPVMAPFLTGLITRRPTLMLGLSAQDSNIQNLFAEAQATMAWPWPSHPPAYVFSENALGIDQRGLLQNVYHLHYGPANRSAMESEALVQAYAKPLLLALLLFVVTAKLKRLEENGRPGLSAADREQTHEQTRKS